MHSDSLFVAALELLCDYIPAALGLLLLLFITIAITVIVIVFLTLPRLTPKNIPAVSYNKPVANYAN
jgi:hypothetical protein